MISSRVAIITLKLQPEYTEWAEEIPRVAYGHCHTARNEQGLVVVDDIYDENDMFTTSFVRDLDIMIIDTDNTYGTESSKNIFASVADARQFIEHIHNTYGKNKR